MGNPNPECTAEIRVVSVEENKLKAHVLTANCKTSTGFFYFTPVFSDGTVGKPQQSVSWTAADSQDSGDFTYEFEIQAQNQVDSVTIDASSVVCSCLDNQPQTGRT